MSRGRGWLDGCFVLRPAAWLTALFLLAAPAGWAASRSVGVARVDVTPSEPIRLTGYAARKAPHVGVEQKLWAKALAIGTDAEGPAVLVTLDNCGIAEDTWREVRSRLAKSAKLAADRIVIASSHTHSAPATKNWAPNIFVRDLTPEEQGAIDRYTHELLDKLEQVALSALKARQPARLSWSQGSVSFAKNRRVVRGNTAQFGDNASGPVDQALPVLKAESDDGKLLALVANYACHCTTLGGEFNHVCGDWAGYAQEAIERNHPGAVALITIGCGADANPSPRGGADGGLALAKKHGEELGAEVKQLLGLTFTPLTNRLSANAQEINLPFGRHFTREQWQARSTNTGIVGYHAKKWLARLDRGEELPASLYYPITTWNFGDELALVFLPGEVVVDYALRLKRELDPQRLWVTAYANYVPCYIPSRRILTEGGYEAEESLWYYDRPARISTNAEDQIIRTVRELVPKPFHTDPKKAEFPAAKTPAQALGMLRTKADLTIELVASEPLIESPVTIDWDARGRLWVCEMFDYPTGLTPPPDPDRLFGEPVKAPPGGFTPGGRVKVLTDSDGDGRFDRADLFLDRIPFPTGVMPWGKGALICAAPDVLYAEDSDGDGRADIVRTNLTGFATHNYQARVNGFTWGLDGWLHGSGGLFGGKVKVLQTGREVDLSGRDFRYRPDTGEVEAVAGISQMGRVRDEFDNWFGNDNSTLLWHYPLPDHYLRRNPHVIYPDPRVLVAKGPNVNRLRPISKTLERFNHPESANIVTGACGPEIYRDVLLGTNYRGNAFVCEPVHNLVRRLVLKPEGATYSTAVPEDEERGEFLASTDNWFRPVQARTGSDGALWIVDMYRFVIEHPRWIPPERRKGLDLRAGADMGRIYKVYPRGAKPRPVRDLSKLEPRELAEAADTPNGPTRDLIHRELVARLPRSGDVAALISKQLGVKALTASDPGARVTCLALLRADQPEVVSTLQRALSDPDPRVRRFAARACEEGLRSRASSQSVLRVLLALADDPDPGVRFQLALTLGELADRNACTVLGKLAAANDPWIRAAVLSSSTVYPAEVFKSWRACDGSAGDSFARGLFTTAGHAPRIFDWQEMLRAIPTNTAQLQPWQWDALTSLTEALDRTHVTLRSLSTSSEENSRDAARRLKHSFAAAKGLALDSKADEPLRLASVGLLGFSAGLDDEPVPTLARLLEPGIPARVQAAATEALRRQKGTNIAALILQNWSRSAPEARGRFAGLLLAREPWARELLDAVERGAVSRDDLTAEQKQRFLQHKSEALSTKARRLFAPSTAERAGVLANYKSVSTLKGATDRGPALFDKNCASCHAFAGRGHAVGPNLAEFAGKSVEDFVIAIVDPNSAINPNFTASQIELKDGRSLGGLVRAETAGSLTLLQGGGLSETLRRDDIGSVQASTVSLMPEGLEQALSPQDLADLIAWLKTTPATASGR